MRAFATDARRRRTIKERRSGGIRRGRGRGRESSQRERERESLRLRRGQREETKEIKEKSDVYLSNTANLYDAREIKQLQRERRRKSSTHPLCPFLLPSFHSFFHSITHPRRYIAHFSLYRSLSPFRSLGCKRRRKLRAFRSTTHFPSPLFSLLSSIPSVHTHTILYRPRGRSPCYSLRLEESRPSRPQSEESFAPPTHSEPCRLGLPSPTHSLSAERKT
jgi:hypothetical protein